MTSPGSGAFERGHRFHDGGPLVQPALRGGRLHHRVLATYVVDGGRHPEALLHPPDDIQVGQPGLDQNNVRALREIQFHLPHRLLRIRAIHLVSAAVAEGRTALGRIAEGAIEGGTKLSPRNSSGPSRLARGRPGRCGWREPGHPSCRWEPRYPPRLGHGRPPCAPAIPAIRRSGCAPLSGRDAPPRNGHGSCIHTGKRP